MRDAQAEGDACIEGTLISSVSKELSAALKKSGALEKAQEKKDAELVLLGAHASMALAYSDACLYCCCDCEMNRRRLRPRGPT